MNPDQTGFVPNRLNVIMCQENEITSHDGTSSDVKKTFNTELGTGASSIEPWPCWDSTQVYWLCKAYICKSSVRVNGSGGNIFFFT